MVMSINPHAEGGKHHSYKRTGPELTVCVWKLVSLSNQYSHELIIKAPMSVAPNDLDNLRTWVAESLRRAADGFFRVVEELKS